MRIVSFGIVGLTLVLACAGEDARAAERLTGEAHRAALRARMKTHEDALDRRKLYETIHLPRLSWPVHERSYRALVTHYTTFGQLSQPLVIHQNGGTELRILESGDHVIQPPQGERRGSFEALGIADGKQFDAIVERRLRQRAPALSRQHADRENFLTAVEQTIHDHRTAVRALTHRPDALLLREYHRRVTKPLEVHTDGIDVSSGDESFLLNADAHISYGGTQAPSNAQRHIAIRTASAVELDRVGLLEPKSFDRAVQRKIVSLARLQQLPEEPATLERARLVLKERMAEVEELDRILANPSLHPYLGLLAAFHAVGGYHSLELARRPWNHGLTESLFLYKPETSAHAIVGWQLEESSYRPQLATAHRLVAFKLDSLTKLTELARAKLDEVPLESIPLK